MDTKTIVTVLVAVAISVGIGFSVAPKGVVQNTLGALTGPDIPSNYLNWGGIREWKFSASPKAASYTLCSFQSPAATSTLKSASISLTTSTTSASTLYIAKAATATATTTLLGTASAIAAGAQTTVVASTTLGAAASPDIIAPNQYINFALNPAASVITNLAPVGTCHVTFEELVAI